MKRRQTGSGRVFGVVSETDALRLQVIGRHDEYGPCVYLFLEPDLDSGVFGFFPVTQALRRGHLSECDRKGHDVEMPSVWRRPGARSATGEIQSWVIEEDSGDRVVEQLTELEERIPIAAMWTHEMLLEEARSIVSEG